MIGSSSLKGDADVPEGWDARCAGCSFPYTFKNAQYLKVKDWQHYCSNLCMEPKPPNRWCQTCGHLLK